MIECTVKLNSIFDPTSAALFIQKASQYKSHISLVSQEKTANAKSIMGLISLNLQADSEVKLVADGEDEQKALAELENILKAAI